MQIINEINLFLKDYPFLDYVFLGNEIRNYIISVIVFIFILIFLNIFKRIIIKKIKKFIERKESEIGYSLVLIVDSVKNSFYLFLSLVISLNFLEIKPIITKITTNLLLIWVIYYIVIITQILINYLLGKYLKKEKDSSTQNAIDIFGKFIKTLLWLFASLLVLSNIGINVTSLMAGLGIGGVAIAFALQNILSDLFSSFSIYFDKPFTVGDFIIVGEHIGVVESIGIKSTRLKALQGEELIISNRELTSTRIQNFKKMEKRRIVFNFGVVYETSTMKLKKINGIVTDIINQESGSDLDRCNFNSFGDFSLNFEVVYFVLSGDYKEFMNIHERIILKIKEEFEKEKISMAFPTQTLYVDKLYKEKK